MDAPTERPFGPATGNAGDVGRASLEATERLRARLTGKPAEPPARPRPVLPWLLAAALLTFALGLIANPWFEHTVRSRLPFTAAAPVPADTSAVAAIEARLARLEAQPVSGAPGLPAAAVNNMAKAAAQADAADSRSAANAERLDKLAGDLGALTARVETEHARSANMVAGAAQASAQAQGALTLILARRAIDAGRPLGALDQPLRQAFEARYPAAVQAVSALGAQPVNLALLRRDLVALRPRLVSTTSVPAGRDWLSTLGDTLAGLVSSAPARPATAATTGDPVDLALQALDHGDVAAAAAGLRRLPQPRLGLAAGWLAAADRWRAGQDAMATLETAVAAAPRPVS